MTIDETDFHTYSQHEGQNPAGLDHPADRSSGAGGQAWHILAEFTLRNEASTESLAKRSALAVIEAVTILHLPAGCITALRIAVESAALNAVEHRDRLHPELPISLCIYTPEKANSHGVEKLIMTPRGWGYFFIEKLTETSSGEALPAIELFLYQEGNL
jgi:hypothetical protein